MAKLLLPVFLLLFAGACAPLVRPPLEGGDCRTFLTAVDRAVTAADCRDAAYYPLPDEPYLRTSRLWSGYGHRSLSGAEFTFLTGQLRHLDHEARSAELACLETKSGGATVAGASGQQLAQRSESCADRLLKKALDDPGKLRRDLAATRVPDDYRTWRRVVGLYPLVSIPVAVGVVNAYAERRDWYRQDLATWLAQGNWQTVNPGTGLPAPATEVARHLAAAAANPLGVPLPDAGQSLWLARNFAPVLVQQQATPADHWGEVERTGGGIGIDPDRPLVYWYLDHLFQGTEPLLRINYVIWYPRRDGGITPWIERGRYDGLTIGVTLAADGRPLLVQSMNNCGCYHQFFPGAELPPPRPVPFAPDPLVPQALPEPAPGQRLAVYVNAGWHQVIRLAAVDPPTAPPSYALADYRDLEQLPGPDGTIASLFDGDGLLPGSERVERWLFFSMGIPSVGSMRQRGHLPITLLGREHYDDPQLLERNFGTE
jgi:hypothetical protein